MSAQTIFCRFCGAAGARCYGKDRCRRQRYKCPHCGKIFTRRTNTVRSYSDIDIAILCDPFLPSKHDENTQFLLDSKEVDLRIQTVCLHPQDFEYHWWALPREVKKHGIPV